MVDFKLNNTAFTLRQLNRARPARFDNRAGKPCWLVFTLELRNRARTTNEGNKPLEAQSAGLSALRTCLQA